MGIKVTKKALALTSIALVIAGTLGTVGYIKLTDRTIIINKDNKIELIQGLTEEKLLDYFKQPVMTIIDSETQEETVAQYSDLGIGRVIEGYSNIENSMIIKLANIENLIVYTDNNERIEEYINEFNSSRVEWVYPTLILDESGFSVTEETVGKQIDAKEVFVEVLDNLGKDIRIETKEFLVERDDTKPTFELLNSELDKINNSYITYTNNFKINAVDMKDFYKIEDNQIVLNKELKSDFIKAVDKIIDIELAEYDTVGKGFEFTTTSGETITVKGGTWGNIFSSDDESSYIVETLGAFKSEKDRTPILIQEYPSTIGDRYVEISLKDQHLWFYDKGELVMESDVVTGTKGRHDTPVGVYFISEMIPGKNLRGDDYVTWVNRWMRLTNRGHGLHDAYWRGAFGGNIYKSNGSHGCIKLPKSFAYKLYEKLNTKDCVIIY